MSASKLLLIAIFCAFSDSEAIAENADSVEKSLRELEQLEAELLVRIDGVAGKSAAAAKSGGSEAVALSKLDFDSLVDEVVTRQKAIYGDDNRQEVHGVSGEEIQRNVRASGALIRSSDVTRIGDHFRVSRTPRGELGRFCRSERFSDQPSPAFCSGFLVSSDVVATAGHCVDKVDVSAIYFVFDFELDQENRPKTKFSREDVYRGKRIIASRFDEVGEDWALVELDRPVLNRSPAKLSRGSIAVDTPIYLIGHPSGLPKKFADGGRVASSDDPRFFTTNVDAFGGNSGSMVVNAITNEVEGVLVRGSEDYVYSPKCTRVVRCPIAPIGRRGGSCGGEDVTRIERLVGSLSSTP